MRKENFYERLDKRAGEILLKSAYKKFEASCLFLAAEAIEKSIESKDRMSFLRKLGGGSLRDLSAELQKLDIQKKRGNVGALVEWAGKKKKFGTVVEHLKGKPGIKDPERLTGWLKEEAKKKGITHKSQAVDNVKKVISGMGNMEKVWMSFKHPMARAAYKAAKKHGYGGKFATELRTFVQRGKTRGLKRGLEIGEKVGRRKGLKRGFLAGAGTVGAGTAISRKRRKK